MSWSRANEAELYIFIKLLFSLRGEDELYWSHLSISSQVVVCVTIAATFGRRDGMATGALCLFDGVVDQTNSETRPQRTRPNKNERPARSVVVLD